jgi:hypothetical protein
MDKYKGGKHMSKDQDNSNDSDRDEKNLKTLVLSTNVNDYDTGEHILEGSIRKTISKNKNSFKLTKLQD